MSERIHECPFCNMDKSKMGNTRKNYIDRIKERKNNGKSKNMRK